MDVARPIRSYSDWYKAKKPCEADVDCLDCCELIGSKERRRAFGDEESVLLAGDYTFVVHGERLE